jgi:hypothetical protein
MNEPSTNGPDGRDANGRFTRGNPGGPGNPHAKRVASLRRVLLDAITEDDMLAIAQLLVAKAREGDLIAIRELLDRTIGKPTKTLDPDRIEADAAAIAAELQRSKLREIFPLAE